MNYEYDPTFVQEPKQENTAAGALGALLGSLAGVVCIVLISRLNFVASVSGLVMAMCALKGYEKLAGTLSKKGAVISCAIIVVMTYFAHHLDITIEIMQELGMPFFEAFGAIPRFLQRGILDGGFFWGNLALLYLFTLLGAVPTIRSSMIKPLPQYFPGQDAPMGGMPAAPMNGAQTGPVSGMPATPAGGAQAAPMGNAPTAPMGTAQPVLPGGIPAARAQTAPGTGAGIYAASAQEAQAPQANIEFFPPDRHMTAKPRYWGLGLALFFFITGFLCFVIGAATDTPYVTPVLGGLVLIFCGFVPYIDAFLYVPDTMFLFARMNGTLWRINLEQLNKQSGYHFTNYNISLTGVRWHKLSPEEQQRAMLSVQYLITAIETAQVESTQIEAAQGRLLGSYDMFIAMPLPEAVLLKETRWGWKISYLANNGKRRKHTIHKSYPGLAPAPGCRPAQQPVPFRWRYAVIPLVVSLLLGGLFLAVDISENARSRRRDDPLRLSSSEPDTRPAASAPGEDSPAEDAGSGTIEITPENYQLLFHLAGEYGYQYIGIGYLPLPAEVFGENMFVDAYVPYCDAPVYSEDGRTLTTSAHGMQVDITVMPTEGSARDAVEAMYEAFAASGADIYEGSVSETEYNEEYGIAVKHLFYFEENGTLPRTCFFYADEPFNGHCYAARIVYLTEQQDEAYPALLQELGDVFGLNLPEIDSFEPQAAGSEKNADRTGG